MEPSSCRWTSSFSGVFAIFCLQTEAATVSNILGARRAIPHMLALFEEFDVAATWATVGCLFATSRQELDTFFPAVLPAYTNPRLTPIGSPVGTNEEDDPLHFAPSLIAAIQRTPRQEIATHTFSHYYCLAPGQIEARVPGRPRQRGCHC